MPIRPENVDRYPGDWREIRKRILARAGNRCEGSPAYPFCRARNHEPHPATGSRVVLTIAHLDHVPENVDPDNLRAWCQRCHNTYDAPYRAAGRISRRWNGDDKECYVCGRTLPLRKFRERRQRGPYGTTWEWREGACRECETVLRTERKQRGS